MILKKSDNNYYPSLLLTVIAVTVYWSLKDDAAQLTVFTGCSWQQALLYHFAHINIFHLVANIMALWTFHPRWMTVAVVMVQYADCPHFCSLVLHAGMPHGIHQYGISYLSMRFSSSYRALTQLFTFFRSSYHILYGKP